ncbi:MAG: GntR family transcriptional regulator [Ferruginibacter sp.]|uniref:aminotransferase-like domain-containing protein n=1 Tax=Ferruginibacter sp. TaxID=1940288 RepID=UPI00265B4C8F|nr:PLP-dependent aminotransferase family protein [Ferruginibacter sp.]MDB5279411.1 GntR family transcriptional regulator [Ferruginibacter sp.]
MKQKSPGKELLYIKIANSLEQQISKDILKVGDKLPSIRMICRQHGVSMSTAQFAYYELEGKSLIESRPQSGYYVSNSFRKKMAMPEASRPVSTPVVKTVTDIFENAFNNASEKSFTVFSRGVPAVALLPIAKLNKGMLQAVRSLPGGGTMYEPLQGNEKLRTQVARWSFNWKGTLSEKDILTTAGCISAISYCLMALTKRGDTIAVESPCFYGILQLAQSLGLKVLELPTSPQTGVDMDSLKKIVAKTKLAACLFVSNFNNPFGSLMPEENKKAAVQLLEQYNVPLIEDDLYGDLYFGDKRPTCCKSYDESGMVLLCSSVSKTLAPAYRVGWVAPGKFMNEVMKIKLFHSLCSTPITHEVIGNFLETGRYEAHLRQLRRTLHANYLQYVRLIGESFPDGTKISRPQGGLSLWVELPKQIDSIELYNAAVSKKITFSPGRMFTLQNQFNNCMRLSYGLEWNEQTAHGLKALGKLAKAAL